MFITVDDVTYTLLDFKQINK